MIGLLIALSHLLATRRSSLWSGHILGEGSQPLGAYFGRYCSKNIPGAYPLLRGFVPKSGADYTLRGKKTLWDEMSESMSLRGAQAVIGVVNLNKKSSNHANWMTNGDDRIIVAVDWKKMDFTLLDVAYQVLRHRVIGNASGSKKGAKTKSIDTVKCDKLLKGILEKMEVIGSMRTKLTGLDKGVEGIRGDLNKLEKGVGADVGELRSLLS